MIEYLGTNIILRYLTREDETLFKRATEIFKEAEAGKRKLKLTALVVAETCFVLESFYKFDRLEIAENMATIVSQKWLDVSERDIIQKVWFWYQKKFHFVDSYLLASAHQHKAGVATFDSKLAKQFKYE